MNKRKLITIAGGCFNEVENMQELYERCCKVIDDFPQYDFQFLFSDNCSTDGTRDMIRQLAAKDKRVKAIFNSANFGHIRSPFHGLMQADSDAVVSMCTDLQDPPELIGDMIREWEKGAKVVIAVRKKTECSFVMECLRRFYYFLLKKSSSADAVVSGFTGFGLYDRQFMDAVKQFNEPYPYFRGMVGEIGFKRVELPFVQPERKHGTTKNNWFTLYDMAINGFVNHSKLPLRLAVFCGTFLAIICLLVALGYLVAKLIWWDTFSLGIAPLVIGIFFLAAMQLLFIGVLGEYIGAIWTQVKNKPLVIEEERINFDNKEDSN